MGDIPRPDQRRVSPKRSDDDRVSDALDRLQNRVSELEAAARRVLLAYDEGRPPSSEHDIWVMHLAIEELRAVLDAG